MFKMRDGVRHGRPPFFFSATNNYGKSLPEEKGRYTVRAKGDIVLEVIKYKLKNIGSVHLETAVPSLKTYCIKIRSQGRETHY